MKYTVIVTKEEESAKTPGRHYDDTIYKQVFEQLDMARLAIFLNQQMPLLSMNLDIPTGGNEPGTVVAINRSK